MSGPLKIKAMILRSSGSMINSEIYPTALPVCTLKTGVLIKRLDVINMITL